jgi:hypothetical protein
LVKFPPDIPILMIVGGDLARYAQKLRYGWESVENDFPKPEIITLNEAFMD